MAEKNLHYYIYFQTIHRKFYLNWIYKIFNEKVLSTDMQKHVVNAY